MILKRALQEANSGISLRLSFVGKHFAAETLSEIQRRQQLLSEKLSGAIIGLQPGVKEAYKRLRKKRKLYGNVGDTTDTENNRNASVKSLLILK